MESLASEDSFTYVNNVYHVAPEAYCLGVVPANNGPDGTVAKKGEKHDPLAPLKASDDMKGGKASARSIIKDGKETV